MGTIRQSQPQLPPCGPLRRLKVPEREALIHALMRRFSGKLYPVTSKLSKTGDEASTVGILETAAAVRAAAPKPPERTIPAAVEVGGRDGLDPTRYGDWELRGRCIDF